MNDMKVNFFTKFKWSILSSRDYSNFIKQSAGKAILYLVLLCLLLGAVSTIKSIYDFNNSVSSLINDFDQKVPDFTLEGGKLKVSGNMPITIKEKNNMIIIDTTGKTTEAVLNQYDRGILITSDKMIQKQNLGIRTTEFSSFAGLTITKASIARLLPLIKWASLFIAVFGILFFFIGKLFSALIVSVFGLIVNSIAKANLSYGSIFTLSIFSLTLPILLKVLLEVSTVKIPFFWILYYGIAVFYLWKAISEIKQENTFEPI